MEYTRDPRKAKIKALKDAIKTQQKEIEDIFKNLNIEKEKELSEEEQKENKNLFKNNVALKKANIQALTSELADTRRNKNSSSFFEWSAHKGMNRQQAKQFRKAKRRSKPTNRVVK